jgi:hypothetical protein
VESYRERLWPSWWLTLALGLFLPAGFLIFLPLNPWVGFGVGMALWWGSWAVLAVFSPVIEVGERGFRAGRATIGWEHVSEVHEIGKNDFRQETGPGLDARAWLVIRPWMKTAVRLTVNDPDDPTPYWLVSTSQPDRVVHASSQWLARC